MLVVLNTCPDLKSAKAIAKTLVEKRLAACVNIIKIEESVYRWEGKLVSEAEYLLIIKTRNEKYVRLEREIRRMHKYEVPEIIAFKVEKGYRRYIEWVKRSCLSASAF